MKNNTFLIISKSIKIESFNPNVCCGIANGGWAIFKIKTIEYILFVQMNLGITVPFLNEQWINTFQCPLYWSNSSTSSSTIIHTKLFITRFCRHCLNESFSYRYCKMTCYSFALYENIKQKMSKIFILTSPFPINAQSVQSSDYLLTNLIIKQRFIQYSYNSSTVYSQFCFMCYTIDNMRNKYTPSSF